MNKLQMIIITLNSIVYSELFQKLIYAIREIFL